MICELHSTTVVLVRMNSGERVSEYSVSSFMQTSSANRPSDQQSSTCHMLAGNVKNHVVKYTEFKELSTVNCLRLWIARGKIKRNVKLVDIIRACVTCSYYHRPELK